MAILEINVNTTGANKVSDLDKKVSQLEKTTNKASSSQDKFASTIKKVATAAVAYIAIDKLASSITAISKGTIETTAQFEQFSAVLTTIEGDSLKAQQSLAWIEEFGKTTPFNIDKVTESFVKLKSYGLDPTDGLLRTLGDTAAAMGKDVIQAVEAIADAVVGENERLKEFGIRANVLGDEIKYSWTNASGEMRQTTIANNSAIIESTLEAIFNSKYAGAMETQSSTWNGMISNLQDNWTIFTKNIMEGGLFDYLKAIVTVVGDYLNIAFEQGAKGSEIFANIVIDAINGTIRGVGFLYDAFNGIELVAKTMANGVIFALNGIIGAINLVFSAYNMAAGLIGAPQVNLLQTVGYLDITKDFQQVAGAEGVTTAERFIADISGAFQEIKRTEIASPTKSDFGETPLLEDFKATISDFAKKDMGEAVKSTSEAIVEMTEAIKSDTGGDDVYTVVNNVNDSFNDFIDTTNEATRVFDTFAFKFEDTFINSIMSNISALESIYKSSVSNTISYSSALAEANRVRDLLIANPLDVEIGNQFKDAFGQFVTSSGAYLSDTSRFRTAQEREFATATIGTQTEQFRTTAGGAVNVLDSMNNLLTAINQSFADGILTTEEKAVISGVATTVNEKNDTLLNSNSAIVGATQGVSDSVNNQEYYNNVGLALDSSLVGSNSVSDFVKDITAGGTVSLSNLADATQGVVDATGLTTAEVATLSAEAVTANSLNTSIKTSTSSIDSKTGKLKSATSYATQYIHTYTGALVQEESTQYQYYKKGGFTAKGESDKEAGVVHAGEWVAPKWMVNSNMELFRSLDSARLNGGFQMGGYTQNPIAISSVGQSDQQIKTNQYLFVLADEIKKMHSLFRRLTDGGEKMRSELVA